MPMDFLRRIEDASFPPAILDKVDIHCAAVLAAAQLIEVTLPEPGPHENRPAVVLRITPLGRAERNRLRERS